jgi:hypothetical protein
MCSGINHITASATSPVAPIRRRNRAAISAALPEAWPGEVQSPSSLRWVV